MKKFNRFIGIALLSCLLFGGFPLMAQGDVDNPALTTTTEDDDDDSGDWGYVGLLGLLGLLGLRKRSVVERHQPRP